MNKPLIIGITGAFGSGKSTAADYIQSLGFEKISLVSFLEDELKQQGKNDVTRHMLQDLGNKWREEYGSDILAKKAAEYIDKNNLSKVVVEGFRNIAEIETLKKIGEFTLIALLVNRDIRFDRLQQFKRREKLDRALFDSLDSRDLGIGEEKTGLQVAFCIMLADIFIENNKDLPELKERLEECIANINKEYGK